MRPITNPFSFLFCPFQTETNKKNPPKNPRQTMESIFYSEDKSIAVSIDIDYVARAIHAYEKKLESGRKYSKAHRTDYNENSRRYYENMKNNNPEAYEAYLARVKEAYRRRMDDPEEKEAFLAKKRQYAKERRLKMKAQRLIDLEEEAKQFDATYAGKDDDNALEDGDVVL